MTDTEGIEEEQEKPWYEKEEEWIKAHIEQRECILFSGETDEVCICTKTREEHELKEGNKKWKRDVNTATEPTKHYGTAIIRTAESVEHVDEEGNVEVETTINEDSDNEHSIEFIRLDEETPIEDVRYLLFEVWNLPRPKWIFCLLGAKMEKDHLHMALRNAFEKLSVTTDVWCLTDGLGGSLSKNVQQAKTEAEEYQTCRITSLGCYSWGELWDIEELKQTENKRRVEVSQYDLYTMGATTSHFLRVDSGTEDPYLCYLSTVSFYVKLVASLASPQDASSAIPVIALLHGGTEPILLEYVKNLIKENIPVLVINNSNNVADLVCQAYENSKGHTKSSSRDNYEGEVTVIGQVVKNQIKKLATLVFSEDESQECVQGILQCLHRRDLITIVDGEDEDEDVLFHGIISAIVKTKSSTELAALIDDYLPTPLYQRKIKEKADKYVEKQKKTTDYDLSFGSQENVNEIFMEALVREKIGCVEFILETSAADIFSLDLQVLYSKTKGDLQKNVAKTFKDTEDELLVKSVVQWFVVHSDISKDKRNIYKKLKGFLSVSKDKEDKPLLDDRTKKRIQTLIHNAKNEEDLSRELNKFLRGCLDKGADIRVLYQVEDGLSRENTEDNMDHDNVEDGLSRENTEDNMDHDNTDERPLSREKTPNPFSKQERIISAGSQRTQDDEDYTDDDQRKQIFRNLFLWAVLTNRKYAARSLWKHGEDLIVSSLVAGTVLDYLAELTFNSKKKSSRENSAMFYKQLTIGTIDACYTNDKDTTVLLLNKIIKQNSWNVDLLALAFEEKNSCVFRCDGISYFTHRRWMGDLPKDTPLLKIIVCTVLPFLIWPLIKLPKNKAKRDSNGDLKKDVDTSDAKQTDENTNPVDVKGTKKKGNVCQRVGRHFEDFKIFYSAPVVKFVLSLVFYLVFIGLYAHFLLVVLKFEFTWNWELSLLVWVAAFTFEEVFQVSQFAYRRKQDSNTNRIRRKHHDKNAMKRFLHAFRKYAGIYFQDKWNILDAFCILGFCIAYPLRCFQVTYSYGRLFLSINFMCFFWKLLQACTPSRSLGPTLYMIFKMVSDLVPFLVVLFATIFSYAIATEALMFPNSDLSFAFFLEIPRKAFWQIFGEFSFEDIDGSNCDIGTCPTQIGRTWVPFFMAAYIIMTNVLLINIVIARFNHIFEEVRQKTTEVWAWQKCRLMMEYDSRPPIPLPFTIFWRILTFISFLVEKCKSVRRNKVKDTEKKPVAQFDDTQNDQGETNEVAQVDDRQNDQGETNEGYVEELDPYLGMEEDVVNTPPIVTAQEAGSQADAGEKEHNEETQSLVDMEDPATANTEEGDTQNAEESDSDDAALPGAGNGEEEQDTQNAEESDSDNAALPGAGNDEEEKDSDDQEWDGYTAGADDNHQHWSEEWYDEYDEEYEEEEEEEEEEYELEADYEDPLDVFERQNAEYYLQTEKDKHS